MRDFQSQQGMAMHGPEMLASLPCDAFRYAFLGNAEKFRWELGQGGPAWALVLRLSKSSHGKESTALKLADPDYKLSAQAVRPWHPLM